MTFILQLFVRQRYRCKRQLNADLVVKSKIDATLLVGIKIVLGLRQMITILFVHGTGVRIDGYKATLHMLRERLPHKDFPDLRIEGCPWGDQYGSRRAEKSVFRFKESGGEEYTFEDARSDMWRLLAADPMAGVRFITLNRIRYPGGRLGEQPPDKQLDRALEGLGTAEHIEPLKPLLSDAGVQHLFSEVCSIVKTDRAYAELKKVARHPLDPYLDALADAIVALSIALAKERNESPAVAFDEELLNELSEAIRRQLGGVSASWVGDWAKELGGAVLGAAAYAGSFAMLTPYLEWRRGPFAQSASPIAGDILVYQSRGDKIREVIKAKLLELGKGPTVLLAHSLGGVACVDLLLEPANTDLSAHVPLLITVGSQAPYFYEINGLHSLPYQEDGAQAQTAFPPHFPRWVNLHNRRDFLSYVGAEVFPGRVEDYEVRSMLPFPQSHTCYFTRADTYHYIWRALRQCFQRPDGQ